MLTLAKCRMHSIPRPTRTEAHKTRPPSISTITNLDHRPSLRACLVEGTLQSGSRWAKTSVALWSSSLKRAWSYMFVSIYLICITRIDWVAIQSQTYYGREGRCSCANDVLYVDVVSRELYRHGWACLPHRLGQRASSLSSYPCNGRVETLSAARPYVSAGKHLWSRHVLSETMPSLDARILS